MTIPNYIIKENAKKAHNRRKQNGSGYYISLRKTTFFS